jgi:ABC-type dipeptide/oligopeptide/nickel transport system ATPase subunit
LGVIVADAAERYALAQLASRGGPVVRRDPFSAFYRTKKIAKQLLTSSATGREAALKAVGLDFECAWRYPYEFSAGQLQRLSLARVISSNPSFIVCDDPLAELDSVSAERFLTCLRDVDAAVLFLVEKKENLPPVCAAYFALTNGHLTEIER